MQEHPSETLQSRPVNYPAKYGNALGSPISANDTTPTQSSIRDSSTGVEEPMANPPSYEAISNRVQSRHPLNQKPSTLLVVGGGSS